MEDLTRVVSPRQSVTRSHQPSHAPCIFCSAGRFNANALRLSTHQQTRALETRAHERLTHASHRHLADVQHDHGAGETLTDDGSTVCLLPERRALDWAMHGWPTRLLNVSVSVTFSSLTSLRASAWLPVPSPSLPYPELRCTRTEDPSRVWRPPWRHHNTLHPPHRPRNHKQWALCAV